MLPSMARGFDPHVLSYLGDIEILSNKSYDYQPKLTQRQVTQFITKLQSYGLYEHEILVLLERFAYNRTFADITDEHGFTDPRTTHKVYKQALERCKKAVEFLKRNERKN